jgi:glucose-1-phosphate adenylyltransferase
VLISEGSQMHRAEVSESVIGVRSIVGSGTRVSRTLMMGADYYDRDDLLGPNGKQYTLPIGIGKDCEIEGALLDKNVRIGPNVTIRPHAPDEESVFPPDAPPGQEMYVIRDGIVVIPKNTEIPAGMVI